MKHIISIIFVLVCSTTFAQTNSQNDIQGFNDFLGPEKANAFNEAVNSFDNFLVINFKNDTTTAGRTNSFLTQLDLKYGADSTWKFETDQNIQILKDWENSGLRKELWIYGYEQSNIEFDRYEFEDNVSIEGNSTYEIGELNLDLIEEVIIPISGIDSAEAERQEKELEDLYWNSQHRNIRGEFFYGLDNYASEDSFIIGYLDALDSGGDISSFLILDAVLSSNLDYEDPFIKRIIVFEFYYWLMIDDIKEN